MWTHTYSKVYPGIKSQDVWNIWVDISNWPQWHPDLEYCKFEGSFSVGNYFMLKPKGMGAVKIELTKIKSGWSFTDCTRFPGARMYDTHELEETAQGLKIKNIVFVEGFLGFIWTRLVAKKIANTIPKKIDLLVQIVRSRNE